eukprot:2161481-Prymnesium_polylepis.1
MEPAAEPMDTQESSTEVEGVASEGAADGGNGEEEPMEAEASVVDVGATVVVEGGEKGAAEEKPPISFEDFKKNKEEAEKAAKEAREAEEKAHKAAEDEARHRARAKEDVVKVDDEDDLGGVVRGYKKRADGST